MDVEERIAKIEQLLVEESKITKLETKSVRIAAFILLLIALAAVVSWALYEFASFLLHLFGF